MGWYHERSTMGITVLKAMASRIRIAVEQLMGSIKEGLLAMCVAVGLQFITK